MKYDSSECNIQIILGGTQDSIDLTGSEFVLKTTQKIYINKDHPHIEYIKKNLSLGLVLLEYNNDIYHVYGYTNQRDGGLMIMFIE